MDDVLDLLRWPLLAVLRGLWWLAWDFAFQTVGWAIGWVLLRLISLGRAPAEGLWDVDRVSFGKALLVECLGLLALCLAIWGIGNALPAF